MDPTAPETKLSFPPGFLLGAASSAHQSEGDNTNSDWWHYESLGRLPKSGQASDHYNRYEQDFELAHSIGLNAMRISIEWARIEPEAGRWNSQAIEHYKKVLKAMKEQGLTRVVTLWHWTLPQWAAKRGGFENPEIVEAFARYAWFVAQNLGTEIEQWITLNEPELYALNSYKRGVRPPFVRSAYSTWRVLENLIEAHRRAVRAIKEALGQVPVGLAKNSPYFAPYRKYHVLDRLATITANLFNLYFLEKIEKQLDFIGLNFYTRQLLKFDWRQGAVDMDNARAAMEPGDLQHSDMGWFLFPEGIYHVLKILRKFKKPIYITENGLADAADTRRRKFILETLEWVKKAMAEGADVKGYFYWSLTDNYEWESGFGPRFGLAEVDYATQARTLRESAKVFKEIEIK